jgi:hypothetical protein
VRIVIELAVREPPAGLVQAEGRPRALAFQGWLDLLRVLSQLLEPDVEDVEPSG